MPPATPGQHCRYAITLTPTWFCDALEMAPSSDYCLRLARGPLVFGIVIASVFPATWLLERFGLLDVSGIAWNRLWTVFVFGFVSPVCLLLLYLLWSRPPIIRLADNKLFLRHVTIPWHNTELPIADVNWVVADWEPETSYCFLKIKVTPSCFHRECHRSRWLHGRDGFLKMPLNNAEETPDQVAMTLNFLLSHAEKPKP